MMEAQRQRLRPVNRSSSNTISSFRTTPTNTFKTTPTSTFNTTPTSTTIRSGGGTLLSNGEVRKPRVWKPKGAVASPGKPSRTISKEEKQKLLNKLTPIQYRVTQDKVTERQFSNKYYKHWDSGSYTCCVCGEPLFSSQSKYDSGSGWPAFYDIINQEKISLKQDLSHVGANLLLLVCNPSLARTEVGCATCGAHIGHVFDDGPKPTGKRFCVNSESLVFTPKYPQNQDEQMEVDEPLQTRVCGTSSSSNCGRSGLAPRSAGQPPLSAAAATPPAGGGAANPASTPTAPSKPQEPLVHLASPSNSCSLGARMCFTVSSMAMTPQPHEAPQPSS